MIDLATENLISIQDIPLRLPPRASGGRIHPSTVYRWIQRGVRGVRLEVIRIGGTTYASLEALQRFADRQGTPASLTPDPVNKSRQNQADEASRAAEAILQGRDPFPGGRRSRGD